MAKRPYRASGEADPRALPVLAGVTLATAIAAGAVEGFISQWFNLFLIFPMALGAIVGMAGAAVVQSRRVRMPLVAAVIGFTAGTFSQVVVHLVEYELARSVMAAELEKDPSAAPIVREHGVDVIVDALLAGEAGGPPLLGYLRVAADHGISLERFTHDKGPTLRGREIYGLWVVELLLAGGFGAWLTAVQAREPFCEACRAWYDREHVVAVGAGDRARIKETVALLERGSLVEAARTLGPAQPSAYLRLVLRRCSKCNEHDPLLELRRVVTARKNRSETKKIYASLITPGEARDIEPSAFAAPQFRE